MLITPSLTVKPLAKPINHCCLLKRDLSGRWLAVISATSRACLFFFDSRVRCGLVFEATSRACFFFFDSRVCFALVFAFGNFFGLSILSLREVFPNVFLEVGTFLESSAAALGEVVPNILSSTKESALVQIDFS